MKKQKWEKNQSTELEVTDVIRILKEKIWVVLLAGVFFMIAAAGCSALFLTPQYESVTKMYVLSQQNNEILTNQDMQTSLSLIKDYAEIIKSRTVTETVIRKLKLNMEPEELLKKMTVDSAADTRVLSIAVRDEDPYEACEIADTLRDVAASHIQNVMNIDAVNIVETANIPKEKISPNIKKNGIIGGILGCMVTIAMLLAGYVMNDTIKTQEDVERYLELSTLGVIPMSQKGKKRSGRKGGRRHEAC